MLLPFVDLRLWIVLPPPKIGSRFDYLNCAIASPIDESAEFPLRGRKRKPEDPSIVVVFQNVGGVRNQAVGRLEWCQPVSDEIGEGTARIGGGIVGEDRSTPGT